MLLEDRPELDAMSAPYAYFRVVTPGFFDTFRVPIVAGRGLVDSDDDSSDSPDADSSDVGGTDVGGADVVR